MYSSLVQILIVILIVFLGFIFYIWRKELSKFKKIQHSNIFLTQKESVKLVTERASLTPDEKDKLEMLYNIAGAGHLHQGLNDKIVAQQWLKKAQRALFHNTNLDKDLLQELELYAFEIFYKVCLSHDSQNPITHSLKKLTPHQRFTIHLPNVDHEIFGQLVKQGLSSFSIDIIDKNDFQTLYRYSQKHRNIKLSFWKKMDAGYLFYTKISKLSTKSGQNVIVLEYPKKLERTKIRRYPRKECELPTRFQLGMVTTDPDTGGLIETPGATGMGLINNIGGNGCSIVSHIAANPETAIYTRFVLFKTEIIINGIVKQTQHFNGIYILSVQFHDNIDKEILLYIYRFLFSDPELPE